MKLNISILPPSLNNKVSGWPLVHKKAVFAILFFTIAFNRDGKEGLYVETKGSPVEFVLISGKPLGEEVAWHGPFVMNKREELMEAFQDYQMGRNGFEGASRWRSQNGRRCGR